MQDLLCLLKKEVQDLLHFFHVWTVDFFGQLRHLCTGQILTSLYHKGIGVVQRSKTLDHRCGGRPMKDGQKIKVAGPK